VAVNSDSSYGLIENNTIKNSASHVQPINIYESGNEVRKKKALISEVSAPRFSTTTAAL
jgi:hypothetical protein